MPVHLSPIEADDLPEIAEFLHAEFPHDPRESKRTWLESLYPPWDGEQPNYGFAVREGGRVVGAYLAHYSQQEVDGRAERFCNLGVWHVLPEFRMQSVPLIRAIISQEGYHFTDLTPAENVVAIDARLGFEKLDTSAYLVPCLPWPSLPGRARVVSDPSRLERVLDGADLRHFRDHRAAGGLRHVAILAGEDSCYVVLRPDRRGRLPVLTVLHVSDPLLLQSYFGTFARHLLLRHRTLAFVVERRLIGFRPKLSQRLRDTQTRMFRSTRLRAEQIGYLYSELVFVPR